MTKYIVEASGMASGGAYVRIEVDGRPGRVVARCDELADAQMIVEALNA